MLTVVPQTKQPVYTQWPGNALTRQSRELRRGNDLDRVMARKMERIVSKNLLSKCISHAWGKRTRASVTEQLH